MSWRRPDHIHFGKASSVPNFMDTERGRRPGTQEEFEDQIRLHQGLPTRGFISGDPVEPIDTHVNTRHLSSAFAWHTLSEKVARIYAVGRMRVSDSLRMVEIPHGIDPDILRREPRLHASINGNSPLVVDAPKMEAVMEMARNGQAVFISPVALFGAMSPIILSDSVIQCIAECIGTIAFIQMAIPGAPRLFWRVDDADRHEVVGTRCAA